jgi:hypothetical protein
MQPNTQKTACEACPTTKRRGTAGADGTFSVCPTSTEPTNTAKIACVNCDTGIAGTSGVCTRCTECDAGKQPVAASCTEMATGLASDATDLAKIFAEIKHRLRTCG